jgi:hypothetical protein
MAPLIIGQTSETRGLTRKPRCCAHKIPCKKVVVGADANASGRIRADHEGSTQGRWNQLSGSLTTQIAVKCLDFDQAAKIS